MALVIDQNATLWRINYEKETNPDIGASQRD